MQAGGSPLFEEHKRTEEIGDDLTMPVMPPPDDDQTITTPPQDLSLL